MASLAQIFTSTTSNSSVIIDEESKEPEATTTTSTTVTETVTSELDDSTDESHSLLWTIVVSPFLLAEWILFTVPTSKFV